MEPRWSLKQAVVIGSSFSGMCAARILSECFEQVIVLEKDDLVGQNRRGVPQHLHSHVVLSGGYQSLTRLFPGLEAVLMQQGALKTDIGTYARWYQGGGWKRNFRTGIPALSCSRALLESTLRTELLALPNVQLRSSHKVLGLLASTGGPHVSVSGVRVQGPEGETTLDAQLVVDCSGRGSRASQWLQDLGFTAPRVSEIPAQVGYVTCKYHIPQPDPLDQQALVLSPAAPRQTRAGLALPIEGHQWTVTVAGWKGDHPDPTHEGILKFAQALPRPDLHQVLLKAVPAGEPVRHLIPSSLRRHFERLRAFPRGFLVMGDAVCSLNPTYGQGITVAVLQALSLQECLSESQGDLRDLWRWFFKRIQPSIGAAWSMVELEDSHFFPEHRLSPFKQVVRDYVGRLHHAATQDDRVALAFYRTLNMLDPPQTLFHPGVLWRVLWHRSRPSTEGQAFYQRSSRL